MAQMSTFTRGYNSFSGVDIKASFGARVVGSLQGISYSVSREKAPVYTMGSADARALARGKRGIAGSLVFIQFDQDPLMYELANLSDETRRLYFLSDIDDVRPEYNAGVIPVTGSGVTTVGGASVNTAGALASSQESDVTSAGSDQVKAVPWYPDQIPPFDVTLVAANEYGRLALMKILAVELMNGGFGISIDDIVAEHSYTYIALGMLPWTTQGLHPDMVGVNPM
jgi:hypothetical protein